MVDDLLKVGQQTILPTSNTEGPQTSSQGQNQGVRQLLDTANTGDQNLQEQNSFQEAARLVQECEELDESTWDRRQVKRLSDAMKQVINEKSARVGSQDRLDEYAIQTVANAARHQLRKMFNTLNPPSEITDTDEFQELLQLLWPPAMRRKGSSFKKGSSMRGSVKSNVAQRLVQEAIEEASHKAGQKMMQQQAQLGKGESQLDHFAQMNFDQMARFLKRRLKTKKGRKLNVHGDEIIAEIDADEQSSQDDRQLQEMMELFSRKALETMRILREEIAPRWSPEQQPWLLQQADQQVFSILLATVDQSLLQETQAWDELQDLRQQQAVFTLRAADKLTQAAQRQKKEPAD
jgi:hypothetical protein